MVEQNNLWNRISFAADLHGRPAVRIQQPAAHAGRLPDTTDPTYQAQLTTLNTNAGGAGRLTVAHQLTSGDEYQRNLIAGLENLYLGTNFSRPLDPSQFPAVDPLVALLNTNNATVEGIVASLLAGIQYYTNDGSWSHYSSHVKGRLPTGGNFLFEDGHVIWHEYKEVTLGGQVDGFLFFYKIKL